MELKQLWRMRIECLVLLLLLTGWLVSMLDEAAAYIGLPHGPLAAFEMAVQTDPNDAKAHFELARAYHEANDLPSAIRSYEQALRLDAGYFEAYVCLASCYRRGGRLAEAKETWLRAFEKEPDRAWKYLYLTRGDNDSGTDEQAMADWQRATELRPDVAWPYMFLGSACEKLQRHDEAQKWYEKARQIDPDVTHWLLEQAAAQCDQGKWQGAAAFYTLALKARPDNPSAHLALGKIHLRLDNKALVLEEYRALKATDEQSAKDLLQDIREKYRDCLDVQLYLGRVHLDGQDYQEAALAFADAVRINPEHVEAHVCLGEALYELGSYDEAVKACRRAIMLEPKAARTHLLLAKAHVASGAHGIAIESLKRALELEPDEPQVHYELGRFYLHVGNEALAVEAYRRLKRLDAELGEALRLQIRSVAERPAQAEIAEEQLETLGRLKTIGFDANGDSVAYFERLSTPVRTGQTIYGFAAQVLSTEVRFTKAGRTWTRKLSP